MANPNIVNVTSILGESVGSIATTSFANLIANASSSNNIYKINSVVATNTNIAIDVDVSINFVRGGTSYAVASNITIPSSTTLIAISKDHGIYLREGDSLQVKAGTIDIHFVCSYEVIS